MINKSTEELKQEYEYIKLVLDFHSSNKLMEGQELEDYVNAALEILKEIKDELERREQSI